MLIELFLRLINASVTWTSRGCWFEKLQNEGPFRFVAEALRLKAKEKNGVRCIMLKQIKTLRRTSPRPRNFLQPGILIVINKSSYEKLYQFQNSLGFSEFPAKVKYPFSYLYFVLLTSVCLVPDDFQTFLQSIRHI